MARREEYLNLPCGGDSRDRTSPDETLMGSIALGRSEDRQRR